MEQFLEQVKNMTYKIYGSACFLILIQILFFIDFFNKDMWGSLFDLFVLTFIAITRIDIKDND